MQRINCRHPNKKQQKGESILPYLFDFDKLTFEPPKPVVCKNKTKHSYTKIIVLVLAVGISWLGVSAIPDTMAYFFDVETSGGNSFGAALLDFELESPSDFAPEVSTEDPAHRDISVTDINSINFHYQVHAENFSGDLCDELHFQAFLLGQEKYAGPLKNFQAGDFGFAAPEDWHFIASMGDDIFGPVCAFDLVYSGWQLEFPIIFSGFHEQERIANVIRTGEPAQEEEEPEDEPEEEEEPEEDEEENEEEEPEEENGEENGNEEEGDEQEGEEGEAEEDAEEENSEQEEEEQQENQAPEITSVPIIEANTCELYVYQVTAVDPNGDILDWYLPIAPEGMTIDFATGLVTWEPTDEHIGEHAIEVFVEDGEFLEGGLNDFQEFVITVVEGNCEIEPEEENNEEE